MRWLRLRPSPRALFPLGFALVCLVPSLHAEQIAVRGHQKATALQLTLKAQDGTSLADGTATQTCDGDTVTDRLHFAFHDGSLYDDTAIFSQKDAFRLLSDHLVEQGPSFPQAIETRIDASAGDVSVRTEGANGVQKLFRQHLSLPADLANGMLPVLIRNMRPGQPEVTVSYLAMTPRPRLIALEILRDDEDAQAQGAPENPIVHYRVKVKMSGLTGMFASMFGKLPPETSFWMAPNQTPGFLKSEGPLATNGPVWDVEIAAPAAAIASNAAEPGPSP